MIIQTKFTRPFAVAAFALVILTGAARAQVASNPPYALEQTVIGGGGGTSADTTGNVFSVTGVVGQPVAGGNLIGSSFGLRSGFFTFAAAAPTAATASISGRVTTADGRGIRNARVMLIGMNDETRYATTGVRGFYRFAEAATGETYILQVAAKRFRFAAGTRAVNLNEELTDADFVADANQFLSPPND